MTEATQAQSPIHTYETAEGTTPDAHSVHEPRTVVHTVTNPSGDTDLFMMTEIDDGVFVQWGECRACGKRVGVCKCPAGPKEPHYMAPWRAKRFKAGLNDRPNPRHDLLPSVVTWLRERGYTVTKKGDKAPANDDLFVKLFKAVGACEAPEGTQVDEVLAAFQEAYDQLTGHTPSVTPLEDLAIPDLTEKEADDFMSALTTDDLVNEDAIDFARETLGEDATEDAVTELAEERAVRDLKEYNVDF